MKLEINGVETEWEGKSEEEILALLFRAHKLEYEGSWLIEVRTVRYNAQCPHRAGPEGNRYCHETKSQCTAELCPLKK